jgi:hypothetical protein
MFSLIEAKKPNIMIILADDVGTGEEPMHISIHKCETIDIASRHEYY